MNPKPVGWIDIESLKLFRVPHYLLDYMLLKVYREHPPEDKEVTPPIEYVPLFVDDIVRGKLK